MYGYPMHQPVSLYIVNEQIQERALYYIAMLLPKA